MAGHVPAIHVFLAAKTWIRDKPGHDVLESLDYIDCIMSRTLRMRVKLRGDITREIQSRS
jgi:hypothetical protein